MKNVAVKIYRSLRRPVNRVLNFLEAPVIVLVYHRVANLSSDPEMLAVSPENFRNQMLYLKENVSLVRFEEDWTKTAKPAVAVTFDDGYADNALYALPILEKTGVPATFFITTGPVGTAQEFWWHELERLILSGKCHPSILDLKKGTAVRTWPTRTDSERLALYTDLVRLMNSSEPESRTLTLKRIRAWASAEEKMDGKHRLMTPDELRSLAASKLVTIGSHTVTHSKLSCLQPDAQRDEIVTSKNQLQEWLGREIAVFSYPFGGRQDFTTESMRLCRQAGFTKAAANFPGQAHAWTDTYRVPRHLVRDWPVAEFTERLRGFWTR